MGAAGERATAGQQLRQLAVLARDLTGAEDLGDRGQPRRLRSRPAQRAQRLRIGHRGAAGGASVQVGREVQSAHVEGHYPGPGRPRGDP